MFDKWRAPAGALHLPHLLMVFFHLRLTGPSLSSRVRAIVALLCLLALGVARPLAAASPARTATTVGAQGTLPATLAGGNGSTWKFGNTSGAVNGLVTPGTPGLALEDALLSGNPNSALDTSLTLWINGTMLVAPATVATDTARTLTIGPVLTGNLEITVAYYADDLSATLRTLASVTNPGGAPATAQIDWQNNVTSDDETGVRLTSSGDAVLTVSDRWAITSDDAVSANLLAPVNAFILFGPGLVLLSPQEVTPQTTYRQGSDNGEGVRARFNLTIPAGATRRLLFFNQLAASNEAATNNVARFNIQPRRNDGLLIGLTQIQMSEVVNWGLPAYEVFLPLVQR